MGQMGGKSKRINDLVESYRVKNILEGGVPYYQNFDDYLGNLEDFKSTEFFQKIIDLSEIIQKVKKEVD